MSLKPVYKKVEMRPASSAYNAGLKVGDILITINNKSAYNLKLAEINKILHGKVGNRIFLRIEREGELKSFKFKLDNALKKNEPSN